MDLVDPSECKIDLETGIMEPADRVAIRKLEDMAGSFIYEDSFKAMVKQENAVVYKVFERETQKKPGFLKYSVTHVMRGRVGQEYFMTDAQEYSQADVSVFMMVLSGDGYLLTQSAGGESRALLLRPSRIYYVPPGWMHKVANTGLIKLVILSVFQASAVIDSESRGSNVFKELVVEVDGRPLPVKNPKLENN